MNKHTHTHTQYQDKFFPLQDLIGHANKVCPVINSQDLQLHIRINSFLFTNPQFVHIYIYI